MKSALIVLLVAFAAVSCSKDDKNKGLDPNATAYISPGPGVKSESDSKYLSAREVIEQVEEITMINKPINPGQAIRMGIIDANRDLERNRIRFFGIWVIGSDGRLTPDFIESEDIVFITDRFTPPIDTIAYVPNKVMREVEPKIKAAYVSGDYATCYKLFEEAFVFIPINGPDWRALKASGKL